MQNFASPARKTKAMELVELRRGIDLAAYLTEKYHDDGLRLADIAIALEVDIATVSRWMDHFGISRRVRTKVQAA